MNSINTLIMLASMLLFISVLASTLSARLGFPLLLLFLTVGMMAGEDGFGIYFSDFYLAGLLGQVALAVILLDGGLRTRQESFRVALKPAMVLATWGVIATVLLLGCFILLLLDLNWKYAFLLAAIVGSTDAAAVFSLLRNSGVKLNDRVAATLEVESGTNDPMAILLVTVLIDMLLKEHGTSFLSVLTLFITQLGVGLLVGWLGGQVLRFLLSHLKLTDGLYPLMILSGSLLLFAFTNLVGGSGFLAVYVGGILVGNHRSRMTESVLRVMDGMAWLAQAAMFVVLGLLVTPSHMLEYAYLAIPAAIFLMLVARPLAVFSSIYPFGFRRREIAFISWVGLRGSVPITLSMMPVMMGVPHAALFFNTAFAVVILSLLVQGVSLPWFAKKFNVTVLSGYEPSDEHEMWLSRHESVQWFAFVVAPDSAAEGTPLNRLPQLLSCETLRVAALMENGRRIQTDDTQALQAGQTVWLEMPETHAADVARLFTDTGQEMLQRGHFFGEFALVAQQKIGMIATLYNLPIPQSEHETSIAQWMADHLGTNLVVGDRIPVGAFYLIVRTMDEQGKVIEAGLKCPQR